MTDWVFVDTNVLVYSRDASEPVKQKRALEWLSLLWRERRGRLSFQVLNEFYVTVTRKLQPGMEVLDAREDVRSLLSWSPTPIDARVVESAWVLQDRYELSWWDALILSAAQVNRCRYLLSEDLQEIHSYAGIQVVNPFHTLPEDLRP